jgi:hypothetical protein
MADNQDPFSTEKSWSNVQGSRSKPRKWKEFEGVSQDKADSFDDGIKKAGSQSPSEAMSDSWNNLKSGINNLLGNKKK